MTNRFANIISRPAAQTTDRGHNHREAFCLMWYGCPCGHRERFWNSRDGVTPFGTTCPTCGNPSLSHVNFGADQYAPDHKPHKGQRVWIDMTRDAAGAYIDERAAFYKAKGIDPHQDLTREQLIDSFFEHGQSPDMVVFGYERVRPA